MTPQELVDRCCEAILSEGTRARVTLTDPAWREQTVTPHFMPGDVDSPAGLWEGFIRGRGIVSYDALDLLSYLASKRKVGHKTG